MLNQIQENRITCILAKRSDLPSLLDHKPKDAIDSTNSGDVIIVKDGVYMENVKVNKSLTIKSENGAGKTIVEAFSVEISVKVWR